MWGQASKTNLNKILTLQKRVLHNYDEFCRQSSTCSSLFTDATISPLNFLYFETVAILMHDINNNTAPIRILNLSEKAANIHPDGTKQDHPLLEVFLSKVPD